MQVIEEDEDGPRGRALSSTLKLGLLTGSETLRGLSPSLTYAILLSFAWSRFQCRCR